MSNNKGIWLLTLVSIAVIGILYFGNFTTKKKKDNLAHAHSEAGQGISFEEYEQEQMARLSETDKELAGSLLKKWQAARSDADKSAAAHDAAHFWADKNESLASYYHYHAALAENNAEELTAVGDELFLQFRKTQDAGIKNNLITFALRSFEAALKLKPDDIPLKLKTGAAYVEGSAEPMKGISLLREVIEKDPNNVPALILLGRFSILSGQFDKAKERLDQALLIDPSNAEALFFMAITQEGLGNKEKAIELFEACKKLVGNPEFDAEIDGYIQELKTK